MGSIDQSEKRQREREQEEQQEKQKESKKREKDQGVVILSDKGIPICSEHGYTLWIGEKNIVDNTAICLYSDDVIDADENLRLTKSHMSIHNIPPELDYLAGVFHSSEAIAAQEDERIRE